MKRLFGKTTAILLASAMWLTPSMSTLTVYADEELSFGEEQVMDLEEIEEDRAVDSEGEVPAEDCEGEELQLTVESSDDVQDMDTMEIPAVEDMGEIPEADSAAAGENGTDGGFSFVVNEDGKTATITGYVNDPCENLTIPATVTLGETPLEVTEIGDSAFEYKNFTGTLTIPASVKEIGSYAFLGCPFSTVNNASNEEIICSQIGTEGFGYVDADDNLVDTIEKGTYTRKFLWPSKVSATIPNTGKMEQEVVDVNRKNKKYLKFEAPSSGMFTVLCSGEGAWGAWIDIRNSDGIDVGTNTSFLSEYMFEGGKTYYIEAGYTDSENLHTYTVTISKTEVNEIQNDNLPVTVSLDQDTKVKWYCYTPDSDTVYYIYSTSTENTKDPSMMLFDSSFNYSLNDDDDDDGGESGYENFFTAASLKSGSKYYIWCHGGDDDSYKLNIVRATKYLENAADISNEEISLESKSRKKILKFALNKKDTYFIRSKGGKELYAKLFDKDGNILHTAEGSDFTISDKLEAGQYYLAIYTKAEKPAAGDAEKFTVSVAGSAGNATFIRESAKELKATLTEVKAIGAPEYFRFKPAKSGGYVLFASTGDTGLSVTQLDDDLIATAKGPFNNNLSRDEKKNGNEKYLFSTNLEKGKTYYFTASKSSDEGIAKLAIMPLKSYVDGHFTVKPIVPGRYETAYGPDAWFSFTPRLNGSYTIRSETDDASTSNNPRLKLFDGSDGTQIAWVDGVDGKEDGFSFDFSYTGDFVGGATYYLNQDRTLDDGCYIIIVRNGPVSLAKATITLEKTTCTYTGSAITPAVKEVKLGNTKLVKDTDFTVSYSNNVNVGTATVTITGKGDCTGTAKTTFTITKPTNPKPQPKPVTGIKLNKSDAVVKVGGTLQLTVTFTPADADDKTVTWSTDKKAVATVSKTGKVTAKAGGKAVITAKASNGKEAKCTVKVAEMTLNDNELVVQKGKTSSAIKVTCKNDSVKSAKSGKEAVATASFKGKTIKVKGVKPGKATITVKSKQGNVAKFKVTVQKKKVTTTKLTVSKKKVTLSKKGKKTTIKVKATPDVVSTGEKIKVSSSNRKIATAKYDAKTGKITITAKKKGDCEVTASAGKQTVTIEVKVKK